MNSSVTWDDREIQRGLDEYLNRVLDAVQSVLEYVAPILEASAKNLAPWEDQTGNARQTLYTLVQEFSGEAVSLYLAHGVEYGIFLEMNFAGRFGIIWDSILAVLPMILEMLQGIFA